MPEPAADNHLPTAEQLDSNHQSLSDDDDQDYDTEEEIEVEEADGEDDEDDFGEDLSPVNQHQRRDVSPDKVIIGHGDESRSNMVTPENAMKLLSTNMDAVEDNRVADSSDMDVSSGGESNNYVNLNYSELGKDMIATRKHEYEESKFLLGTRAPTDYNDAHHENKAVQLDNGILNVQTTGSFINSGAELDAAVSVEGNSGENTTGLAYIKEEKMYQCPQTKDFKLNEPRLDNLMLKSSSLSPGVEHKEGTDKPAVICDFFAKGWCIKGSSCRFLHTRDVTTQEHVGAEADASHKTELRNSEGLDCSSKKPRLASSLDEAVSAIGTSYSLDRVLSHEVGQSSKKNVSEELSPYKDNSRGAGRERLRELWYLNDHAKHGTEELAAKRSQLLLDEHIPLFRNSWETRFSTGTLPPTHISSRTRSSLPFGSTWNSDPLGSQKFLDGEGETDASQSTSLHKASSPFSGSESSNPFRKPVSNDFQHSVGYKTERYSCNWEPSPPFRPMFALTKSLLSSLNQYDPIRDSMVQSKSDDLYSRYAGSGRESNGLDYNFADQSPGRHHNVNDNNLNKRNNEKDLFSDETGPPLFSIADKHIRIATPKEEKSLGSAYLQDSTKRNTPNTENDDANHTDRLRRKLNSGDIAGQISEMEGVVKIGEDMGKETKAVKHFRAVLIDFVKELVKPTWREGNLSKDAHKLIVKRSVDRVISTIPTHQIPSTPESVGLYLSSSELKIAKLVEGYIDKYGKP